MNQISKINLGGVDYDIRDNSKLTPIAYADLVSLRDNGNLVVGSFYRITDYITTTAQENTQSAGHPFDVIVLALSENTLSEEAYAIQSERDTDGYFAESNLSAWKLWYSLDNDTERFAWADEVNGKGVIYRMIDEWNNDVPYDFKNIQYEDKPGFTYTQWGKASYFSRSESLDKVIDGVQYYGYTTVDTPIAWSEGKCWITDAEPSTTSSLYNQDGSAISYGGSIISVTIEYRKYYTFAEANDLKGGCFSNEVKSYLKMGAQNLNKIRFGEGCHSNSFGNDCNSNSFHGATSEDKGHYYKNNHLGDGVQNCGFTNSATASSSQRVQNYDVAQGLSGKTIAVTRNLAYETKVALTTSGELKMFNLADLA